MDEETKNALDMLGAGYNNQPGALIEPSKKVLSLTDGGLGSYSVWGWVKISAKFQAHIKNLKGARLAIWLTIALNIDETGKCNLTIKELMDRTGYSHTEIIDSLRELAQDGYLSIDKSNKSNVYAPAFASRGGNSPTESVKKLDSSPVDSLDSSPARENPVPTIKELKELNNNDNPRPNVFTLYEQNIGSLTPMIADALKDAESTYPAEWIRDAIQLSVEHNKRNWKYCAAILKRWQDEGKDNGKPPKKTDEKKGKYTPAAQPQADNFMQELAAKKERLKQEAKSR